MKAFGKRLMGLLLAAALLAAALPSGALALEGGFVQEQETVQRGPDGQGGFQAVLDSEEGLEGGFLTSREELFGAPYPSYDSGDFYSQLTQRQKACYDALARVEAGDLWNASAGADGKVSYHQTIPAGELKGMENVTMTGSSQGGKFVPSGESKTVESGIFTDLFAALVALRYDRPEILWVHNVSCGYRAQAVSGNAVKVTYITFDYHLEYGGKEEKMYGEMMESARAVADKAAEQPDTYSKVKAVHDILAQANSYGDTSELVSHTAYAGLVTGGPVCDGYAKAFKIVCGLLDIPCTTPSKPADQNGPGHMWNNVKMDDGAWYNIDLTWDDSNDEAVSYRYFLIGSETAVDGVAFSQQKDHVEENPFETYRRKSPGSLLPVTMVFPTKNKSDYKYLGEDYTPLSFPDVKRDDWYYADVETVHARGLFNGDTNGLFSPGRNISRAEFAQVMAALQGADLSQYTIPTFTDISKNDWYARAVAWAQQTGLIHGYPDGTFRPRDPISRQEMCVVLCSSLESLPAPGDFKFPDDQAIGGWARESVYACQSLGLVNGGSNGAFAPKNNTKRCEAAALFARYLRLNTQPEPDEGAPDESTEDEGTPDESMEENAA